jgi:hypothetical protein
MSKIVNEEDGGVPVNNTSGVASLNPADPRNPPVFSKKKKLLKDILKRKK